MDVNEFNIYISANESWLILIPWTIVVNWLLINFISIFWELFTWVIQLIWDYINRVKYAKIYLHKNFTDPQSSGYSKSLRWYRRVYFGSKEFDFNQIIFFSKVITLYLLRRPFPWPEMKKRVGDKILGFRVTRRMFHKEAEIYFYFKKQPDKEKDLYDMETESTLVLNSEQEEKVPGDDEYCLTYIVN